MSNLIYGMHSVDGAVRGNHVDQLYVCKDRNSEKVMRVIEAAQKNKIPVSRITKKPTEYKQILIHFPVNR